MRLLKQAVAILGTVVVIAVIAAVVTPKTAHAIIATAVQVVNGPANPVPTTMTDNPALHPFLNYQIGSNPLFSFQVPASNTLVIEEFSMTCIEGSNTFPQTDFRLFVTTGGNSAQYTFAPAMLPGELIATQQLRVYADPGTTVTIGTGAGVANGSNCASAVSGHLVSPL
jgi:hypothetical protein